MEKRNFIDKENSSEFHPDIKQLYNEGIELIQHYAGDLWTDYNEHDPGVTILENLVYAITDLCYRMGFDTVDYLMGDNGEINTKQQALYEPHEILTTQPVTIADYRKLIFDRINDISNVWLEPVPPKENHINGLYRAYLIIKPDVHFSKEFDNDADGVRRRIKRELLTLWPKIRNLGEDLLRGGVTVLEKMNVVVHTKIVLKSANTLENVLASIVFELDNYFNPEMATQTLDDMMSEGATLDEIFQGPSLKHGFVKSESLDQKRPRKLTKAQIVSIISKIEGVDRIENLFLSWVDEQGNEQVDEDEVTIPDGKIARLILESETPDDPKEQQRLLDAKNDFAYLTIKMRRKNSMKYIDVELPLMLKTLRRKQALRHRVYATNSGEQQVPAKPKGMHRALQDYSSIQNQFPSIYAINLFGTSKYEPATRQAQALQLKAYLLLFEQLMGNFTAQVSHLKQLYSVEHLRTTYFYQTLLDSDIGSIERLYFPQESKEQSNLTDQEYLQHVLPTMLHRLNDWHPHTDRKSRVLDYMLAIYGEQFNQSTLRRIDDTNPNVGKMNEELIVRNKAIMIQSLRYFNTNSAKAPRYTNKVDEEKMSGFELKLATLLSINPARLQTSESLLKKLERELKKITATTASSEYSNPNFVEVSDQDQERISDWESSIMADHGWIEKNKHNMAGLDSFEHPEHHELDKYGMENIALLNSPFLTDQLLKSGANEENYLIYKQKNGPFRLVVKVGTTGGNKWYQVGGFNEKRNAALAGYKLAHVLQDFNSLSERFTIIDHLMLRPTSKTTDELKQAFEKAGKNAGLFHSFTCSIVFTKWSKRFSDPVFQQLAEESILFNIPSHIEANVYWLNINEYRQFETHFLGWLKNKRGTQNQELIRFLLDLQVRKNNLALIQ